ncbi:hypothetical protein HDC94_000504 [Leifsonia sp. AK011]|uniref:hypothetical protein n=1 Tax=Leifsonia sp. AK011 TaxID=2723075 RepID=UPI0015C825ED|nr:hypothetical protein [Leifsonia sp. AK011]NYF09348.1 hypothetical protein [Leifsonia sp. AK011]
MTWNPLRLTQKRWKAVYIVGGYLVIFVINVLLPQGGGLAIITLILDVAWIYGGTRIFRGAGELVQPPRPWWRMTARPRAGFVLGILVFAPAVAAYIALVATEPLVPAWWLLMLENVVWAALYVSSSVRLTRGAAPEATPASSRP